MGILDGLREEMRLLEEAANHDGYWNSISGVMTILVCGIMYSGLPLFFFIYYFNKPSVIFNK